MKIKLICLVNILLLLLSGFSYAADNEVIIHPAPDESIDSKWSWALQQSNKMNDGVWIGWGINRIMPENAIMGIYISGDNRFDYPTLEQIIYKRNLDHIDKESISEVAQNALNAMDEKHSDKRKLVEKEIAILFYYESNPNKNNEANDIIMSNINLYADLDNKPVIWLGNIDQNESAKFLVNQYNILKNRDLKEDFMAALGIHQQSDIPVDFLTSVVNSNENNSIREKAVFWLGEHDDENSVEFIVNTAYNDRSNDVREKAVFALYLMESQTAEDALIELARNSDNTNLKKKAIFWLGQKAAEKSGDVLEEIVEHDQDTEVKEQAVFALSQLDDNEGIPALIDIAKNHSNYEVRKKAIFWLGHSGDDRALDVIISLIQNN